MKSVIQWAIRNTPAMNMLMISIIVVGAISGMMLHREEFPRFELEIILVTVPYPGASPEEVESGVCQKIEEAVRSIDGVKKVTSVALEGAGNVIIEVKSDAPSVQKVLNEVESEINRIPSFPDLAEEPEIQQLTMRRPAIKVGVVAVADDAPDLDRKLRDEVERVRDDLLLIPQITTAEIQGERDYQIDVEISQTTLRKHGLTLQEVARRLRERNLEMPGGNLKDRSQEFLLRGKNKRLRGEEIAQIPLVTKPGGVVLTVGDLAEVKDEFVDTTSISRINGKPGLAISVEAAAREDLLAMTQAVRDYVAEGNLPAGFKFEIWGDSSIDVRDRLELLQKNGLQGLALVFLVLALFLELRLAFWVALGIPISIFGACAVLMQLDQTLNMLSMFAFLIALGIVVDDAIVIGENIYAHRELGKPYLQAAIEGTVEVLPSVLTSITTTIFAFVPMFFVTGVMGKFFAVLPLAVIAMLIISLVESSLVLPCHLAHDHNGPNSFLASITTRAKWWRRRQTSTAARCVLGPIFIGLAFVLEHFLYPFRRLGQGVGWVNRRFGGLLEFVIRRFYTPALHFCMRRPAVVCSTAAAVLILSISLVRSGAVPWVIFPKIDARLIEARLVFPDGTPSHVTDRATRRMEQAILAIHQSYQQNGEPIVRLTHRLVGQVRSQAPGGPEQRTEGSHAGVVSAVLVDNKERSATSQEIVDKWRRKTGEIAGVETLTFGSVAMGPGGSPIEFRLLGSAEAMDQLEAAVEACKEQLATFPGVFDISDDSRPGKWELQIQEKEDAQDLGVPLRAIAGAVRGAYYGEEVMRLQRGRHEVKLMVRYPEEERRSFALFNELRVDAGDGAKRPLFELATINVQRGYSEINRVNQKRSITVTADVDESRANASEIVADLRANFMPDLLKKHPQIQVRWEGQQEQTLESVQSLFIGLVIALLATFVLLTLEFRSYAQPAIVMAVIPFGAIGALWGHFVMGLPLTLFSVMGLVALTGVVVNDSIVLVDFANARLKEGMSLRQALIQSGQRRFRPVILTSLTTVAGLLPILLETSLQAQLLIPMANSLCFGLIVATTLVLFLVPTFFSLYGRWTGMPLDGASSDTSSLSAADLLDQAASPEIAKRRPPQRQPAVVE